MNSDFQTKKLPIKVFDFFAGCGGTSKGFKSAGMELVLAIDNDPDSKATFETNFNNVNYIPSNIYDIETSDIKDCVFENSSNPLLFSGCAPCQPFTKQNTKQKHDNLRKELLLEFLRFIATYKPEYVFVENVPGLQNIDEKNGPFKLFLNGLDQIGYHFTYKVIASQEYGVPQMRRRLLLIGSLFSDIDFPQRTHGPDTPNPIFSTVRDWISHYPPIRAGEKDTEIPNHRAAGLSEINIKRISILKEGGDRRDWPEELVLDCHKNDYSGHTDVYGRMWWDKPASGLTTRCISLSNGRFGHPEQNRAISVREAAAIQTFPDDFVFVGNLNSMARQIGNAVPVKLAEKFGINFINHFTKHGLNNAKF